MNKKNRGLVSGGSNAPIAGAYASRNAGTATVKPIANTSASRNGKSGTAGKVAGPNPSGGRASKNSK